MPGFLMRHCLAVQMLTSLAVAACTSQHPANTEKMAAFPKDSSSPPHEAAIQIDDADEPEPDDEHAQITAGRQIAIRDCSACHAIDGGSTSPHAEAPPLKNALWRFEEDALATHLIEAIRIGHGEMPLFDLSVVGADALIAYLRSIRSSADKQSKQGYGRDE